MDLPTRSLRLTSTRLANGRIELELQEVVVGPPSAGQVVVRVEAAPINPSDILTLLRGADPTTAHFAGTPQRPVVTAQVSPPAMQAQSPRIGKASPVGLEGAGLVVAAGEGCAELLGRRVAFLSYSHGAYAEHCTVSAAQCLSLPTDVSAAEGAALFVNPLTALAMVETARQEGYTGLVHTAAASSLGQMLVKICQEDDVPLVNIVRRPSQLELLRAMGAEHVCDSSAPSFRADLQRSLAETGAILAFDAIGGGKTASEILQLMEAVAAERLPGESGYGSSVRKQVYIYGRLDPSPIVLPQGAYGMVWGVAGWAMPPILQRAGPERGEALRRRVVDGLRTTFATRFSHTISLTEMLQRDAMLAYTRLATGEKFLVDPLL